MRYRIFKEPRTREATIWVIPTASTGDYLIVYPRRRRLLINALSGQKLRIRSFAQCSELALVEIREKLKQLVTVHFEKQRTNIYTMFVGGVALAVLGIVNGFIPDPVPAADEVLLIGAGVFLAIKAARRTRDTLPFLKEEVIEREQAVDGLLIQDDPVLSRIFEAVRRKERPEEGVGDRGVDRIDLESRWLVESLDIENLLASEEVNREELRETFELVRHLLPLHRLYGPQPGRPAARLRRKRLEKRVRDRFSLTDDALTVYTEFYRIAREILENRERS